MSLKDTDNTLLKVGLEEGNETPEMDTSSKVNEGSVAPKVTTSHKEGYVFKDWSLVCLNQ